MFKLCNCRGPFLIRALRYNRTLSTHLKCTDQVFQQTPPSPPSVPRFSPLLLSTTLTESISKLWKEDPIAYDILDGSLGYLRNGVVNNRKRQVAWPIEDPKPFHGEPADYLHALLGPIADLINQLHGPYALKRGQAVSCSKVNYGGSIVGITFTADQFQIYSYSVPVVIYVPANLYELDGKTCSISVAHALSKILEDKKRPRAWSVIVTNFTDIAVFFPKTPRDASNTFVRVESAQVPAALRVISAACLLNALPRLGYFAQPSMSFGEPEEGYDVPMGPPRNPDEPLLEDEQVIATHHRHSDFDRATLIRDRARALQFFRWKEYIRGHNSKIVARVDETLCGATYKSLTSNEARAMPIYPFEVSEIPPDTTQHLHAIRRESPLAKGAIDKALEKSKAFTLRIQETIAGGLKAGFCTVYRCQLTSIDGHPVPADAPSLCLKLFDDRFQDVEAYVDFEEPVPRWFDAIAFAERSAESEASVYDKLRPVQGTVVPWFYGNHQITLSNGLVVQGLLMEYVEGHHLTSDYVKHLEPDKQIQFIHSCRHAVRVLDIADISQLDWHKGQVLMHTHPTTQEHHAVLIDFALTQQTTDPARINLLNNYFRMYTVLVGAGGHSASEVALDPDLALDYYGDPDEWETSAMNIYNSRKRNRSVKYKGSMLPGVMKMPILKYT